MVGLAIFQISVFLIGFTAGAWVLNLFRSSFDTKKEYNTQMFVSLLFFILTSYLSLYIC